MLRRGFLIGLPTLATIAVAPDAFAQAALAPPGRVAVIALVRTTLLAVDQANKTGNYTVLRDLAAPRFRDNNNATRLGQIFGPLASQGVDLLPVAVTDPVFSEEPSITEQRMLRVRGGFQIAPRAVVFEIVFEAVNGEWRFYSIAILPA